MGWDLCISNFNCHFAVFIVVIIPSISGQCSLFIPPENARKPKVFWCFEGSKKEHWPKEVKICQFLSIDFGKRCIPRECFSIIRKIVLCNQEFSANRVLYFISNFQEHFMQSLSRRICFLEATQGYWNLKMGGVFMLYSRFLILARNRKKNQFPGICADQVFFIFCYSFESGIIRKIFYILL